MTKETADLPSLSLDMLLVSQGVGWSGMGIWFDHLVSNPKS